MTTIETSPASLFLRYWHLAAEWTAMQRATAPRPDAAFQSVAAGIVGCEDGAHAHDALSALVETKTMPDDVRRGRILSAMMVIDDAFYAIHPRALIKTTSSGGVVKPPLWLRDIRSDRMLNGDYARDKTHRLIPRGPLGRACRTSDASSGELLADNFAALVVVPCRLNHDDRIIEVSTRIVPIGALSGVPASLRPGEERVGFVPLATEAKQIEVTASLHDGRMFADYKPAASFDASLAATTALTGLADVDIVVMPELALNGVHVEAIVAFLAAKKAPKPRMVVAGSCLSSELSDDLPFNESRVLNGRGVELWRQRKIWTAGVGQERAIAIGLPDPGAGVLVLENTACDDTLVVADVDGLGRCIVLICQDLTTPSLSTEATWRFQPDWVFVPILDKTIDKGRWAHSRAYALSDLAQTRFVAITNTSFAGTYASDEDKGMGMAVGPKEPSDSADEKRVLRIVPRPAPGAPQWDAVTWRDGHWQQTDLTAKDP